MAWSNAFIAALGAPVVVPLWRVVPISTPLARTVAGMLTSHRSGGGAAVLTPAVRVNGDGVEAVTWSPTWGGWECEVASLTGDGLQLYRRGMIAQLQLSLDGGATWVAAALGVLQNVRVKLPTFSLSFAGLGTMLSSRCDYGGVSFGLFADVPASTVTTVDYVVGDTTLTVSSTTGFERESGTGKNYLIKLTQGSVTFYLLATGKTGTTFTGVSATGAVSTTAQNVTAGATVDSTAYVYGHPLDIARKILVSTGTGTNGVFDTLPASWGLGVPDVLLDHIDIARTRAAVQPASGSWDMSVYSDAPVTAPMGWMLEWLNPIAVWPTVRQGMITFRCAQIPSLARVYQPPWPIDDRSLIAGGVESTWYMDSCPVEFYVTTVTDTGLGSTNTPDAAPKTVPAQESFSTELLFVFDNRSAIRSEVLGRTAYWPTRPPEYFRLTCAGLALWALAPGDLVTLTSAQGLRRPSLLGGSTELRDYAGLVLNVQPDLAAGTVALDVACLPELSD